MPVAHEDTSSAATAASPSSRTALPSTISPAASEQTKNPWTSRSPHRLPVVQTPAGERYTATARCRSTIRVSCDDVGNPVSDQRPDRVPADRPYISIAADGNVSVLEGVTGSTRCAQAAAGQFRAGAAASEGSSNLFSAGEGNAAQPDITSKVNQALSRDPTSIRVR